MREQNYQVGLTYLVDGFLFSIKAEGRSPRTHQYYQKLLRHFLDYAKEQQWPNDIRSIDATILRQFLSWIGVRNYPYSAGHNSSRQVKSKPSTAWPYFTAIRRLFNWAIDEGFLESSPIRSIRFKPPPPAPIQPYSEEEINKLLSVCETDIKTDARFTGLRNKAILLLFLDSGLRLHEMAELCLGDLDMEEKNVRVVGKGNQTEFCPFSAVTAIYLHEKEKVAKSSVLWVKETGYPFTINGFEAWFVRLKSRAGIHSPDRLHRLRHTAALQYLRGARDSFLLQLFMRHKDLAMSRRYTQGLKHEEAIAAHRQGASPVERLGLK